MAVYKCESCGAPLKIITGRDVVLCEYCGTENTLKQSVNDDNCKELLQPSNECNVLILSIPSCGSTIFQKKLFNIYQHYAELVDEKNGSIEIHIDYCNVVKRTSILGTNIVFKMDNGKKITIKCLYERKFKMAQQALNGLV